MLLSAQYLLVSYGVLGIGVILFLETGLLFGVILPGETLTVLAGAYSHVSGPAGTHPNLALVIAAAGFGAIAGGQLGYLLGRRAGPRLFARPDGVLFSRSRLDRTREYFRRYGVNAIVIGRFVPFLQDTGQPGRRRWWNARQAIRPLQRIGRSHLGRCDRGDRIRDRRTDLRRPLRPPGHDRNRRRLPLIPLALEIRAMHTQDRAGAA